MMGLAEVLSTVAPLLVSLFQEQRDHLLQRESLFLHDKLLALVESVCRKNLLYIVLFP